VKESNALLELLGEDLTLKLMEAYGGRRVGVPKEMPEQHELRELLGDSGFALIFQYFGGSEIAVPMARRWRFEVYERRGLRPVQIAKLASCTEAAYYKYRSEKHTKTSQFKFAFE
jgi:hypothetical protein